MWRWAFGFGAWSKSGFDKGDVSRILEGCTWPGARLASPWKCETSVRAGSRRVTAEFCACGGENSDKHLVLATILRLHACRVVNNISSFPAPPSFGRRLQGNSAYERGDVSKAIGAYDAQLRVLEGRKGERKRTST